MPRIRHSRSPCILSITLTNNNNSSKVKANSLSIVSLILLYSTWDSQYSRWPDHTSLLRVVRITTTLSYHTSIDNLTLDHGWYSYSLSFRNHRNCPKTSLSFLINPPYQVIHIQYRDKGGLVYVPTNRLSMTSRNNLVARPTHFFINLYQLSCSRLSTASSTYPYSAACALPIDLSLQQKLPILDIT